MLPDMRRRAGTSGRAWPADGSFSNSGSLPSGVDRVVLCRVSFSRAAPWIARLDVDGGTLRYSLEHRSEHSRPVDQHRR